MRTEALVMQEAGRPLRVEQVDLDAPASGEVLVRLRAAGVCRSDLHAVDGEWRRPTPIVLGHEGAGQVAALGAGVTGLAVGDHVVLTWLPPCGQCRSCRAGRTFLCSASSAATHLPPDGTARVHRMDGTDLFQYSGIGTLSGASVVPAAACVPVPREVPFTVAALIGCGAATGWGAVVNTAAVTSGQSVVVVGCGGVGLSAVMAAAAGATPVVAVDVQPDKLAAAVELGATHAALAEPGWPQEVRQLTDGVDVGFDCIGDPAVVGGLFEVVVPGGAVVLVGMTAQGVTIPVDGYRMPDAGFRLLGSAYGSCVAERDFPRIAGLFLDGALPLDRLVSHRIGLAEVPEALAEMRAGRRLRSVVTWSADSSRAGRPGSGPGSS
ncbi:MAG: alcohol dehydrogenase catalytic domain-containing protein [Actinomycetota bacterium]|nr:alcohol dehydrogenase catalytic domain-containing protein [Actinomycetota bacterium]